MLCGGRFLIMNKPYVDFCEPPDPTPERKRDALALVGVPLDVYARGGVAWRICVPVADNIAVSVLGFARKRDAEAALEALNKASGDDVLKLVKIPFEERTRIMVEALAW